MKSIKFIKNIPYKKILFIIVDILTFILIAWQYKITNNEILVYVLATYIPINLFYFAKFKKKEYLQLLATYLLSAVLIMVLLLLSRFAKYLESVTKVEIDVWMNFLGALSGSIITVLGAYWVFNMQSKHDKKERDEYAKAIIDTFVSLEIENNFIALNAFEISWAQEKINHLTFDEYIRENIKDNYYYNHEQLQVSEFDKIKYDLIKYKSDDVKQVIELYEMFNILKKKDNIADLNLNEYHRVRHIYLNYLQNPKKYIEK